MVKQCYKWEESLPYGTGTVDKITSVCTGFRASGKEDILGIRVAGRLYKLLQEEDGTL